ncbi:plasmid partitioning protein RepB [Phyllobacterium sp. TAF24]|jgi:ParB family chromosome partitioning protein|uniref:plasmid partitioning protein RepB n=1 Tax=unclassified Phyllobacterium TaxID=2638441 RepID=UPI0008869FDC|nr:plasmid partitioning protein RepB [Phyllobacterium sp. OV277]SDP90671.1 chromosome partitioning protein, ParB family [Phyllobacterium sp. OV277]
MTDKNRRDQLKALFGTVDTAPQPEPKPVNPAPVEDNLSEQPKQRTASGAIKAMGLSLGGISRELEDARKIRESLEGSERVIEIDPQLIEYSFVEDRLSHNFGLDETFRELVESIKLNGQQVPILVRPHPERRGYYQTAYGHRRLRAAAELKLPVQAIIRELSDAQLVVAQGKENAERRDLSFIERAFFARNLIDRGFSRSVVQDALALHKAEMTRYLQVVDAIPKPILQAIGPAPKVGRPRWVKLADMLRKPEGRDAAQKVVQQDHFKLHGSDGRFDAVFERLLDLNKPAAIKAGKTDPVAARDIRDGNGDVIAQLLNNKKERSIDFADTVPEGFVDFVAGELNGLLQRYRSERKA